VESLERFAQNQCIIEEFVSEWLADISSLLGRLIRVARLRDISSGRYYHPALEERYPALAVHEAFAYCHQELYERVLECSLEHLERDLRLWLAGIDAPASEIASRWLEVEYFRLLVPSGTPPYLRDLFFSNLRLILGLIAADHVAAEAAA
jgi:hypothetical protein